MKADGKPLPGKQDAEIAALNMNSRTLHLTTNRNLMAIRQSHIVHGTTAALQATKCGRQ